MAYIVTFYFDLEGGDVTLRDLADDGCFFGGFFGLFYMLCKVYRTDDTCSIVIVGPVQSKFYFCSHRGEKIKY